MKKRRHIYLVISLFVVICPCISSAGIFSQAPISEELLQAMIKGNAFNQNSPVPVERLRLLTIQHTDFEGNTKTGQMIVLDVCADAVLKIFEMLHERSFPIHKVQLIHHYQGDDEQSMADNNSSAYNCRTIAGADKLSLHAYGAAIDINPIQNPCVYIDYAKGVATYAPRTGIQYANRRLECLGKPTRAGLAEEVVAIFAENGFYSWGGYWDVPIDYQHFQLSRSLTELYIAMDAQSAKVVFDQAKAYFNKHQKPMEHVLQQRLQVVYKKEQALVAYYKQDQELFNKVLQALLKESVID